MSYLKAGFGLGVSAIAAMYYLYRCIKQLEHTNDMLEIRCRALNKRCGNLRRDFLQIKEDINFINLKIRELEDEKETQHMDASDIVPLHITSELHLQYEHMCPTYIELHNFIPDLNFDLEMEMEDNMEKKQSTMANYHEYEYIELPYHTNKHWFKKWFGYK